MADKALSKLGWRGFSGSQASVGAIALMAFLLAACILPLILTSQGEVVVASPDTFPVVAAENGGNNPTDSTEHTVNLPSGIQEGDLLLIFFASDGVATITFPEGWTQLFQTVSGTAVKFGAWYRIADGGEGATITVTTSSAQKTAHTTYRITGYLGTPEVGTSATGASTNPDSPSLTPSWGAKDTLWFAVYGNDGDKTVTVYPTDYTDGRNDYVDDFTGCGVGSARRELNAESENPSTFTISLSDQWVANTVAIQPSVEAPQEYERPIEQGFSVSATVEIEVERFAQEYERSVEQSFSLAESAPRGAEFGRVIEQGFSIGAAVGMVMVVCRLLSQAFGITGTIGVTSEWGKSLSQGFSITSDVSANMERWGAIDQTFSLDGSVSAVAEYGREVSQPFSISAEVDVAIQRLAREYERGVAQGFSFEDTVIAHEYGDIYATSPWCDNRANPIDVVADPTFSAIYTVTDNNIPNPAQFIQIQVGTSWDDNDLWDNIATVTVENGQRSPNVSYDGMPLTLNSTYWWRCRFGDSNGNLTEWTSPQTFGYQEPPFDLVAAAMFIFPIVLMAIAFAFDNVVFASFAGIVFILSGLFFVDVIWFAMIFVGVGAYLLITAFLSEED